MKVRRMLAFPVLFSVAGRKGFWKEKKSLICYVILDPGHDFEKVKSA